MAKTLVDIPDELLNEARMTLGAKATKSETIRQALTDMVRRYRQREALQILAETDLVGELNDPAVRAGARR